MTKLLALLVFCVSITSATVVTDTIRNGAGVLVNGTIYVTPNQKFTTTGGIPVYPTTISVQVRNGVFSVTLYANDATQDPASGTSYSARYALNGYSGAEIRETWVVPTSASPVSLSDVRTNPTPSPSVSGYITSLNGLNSVTQLFARANDTNVTLAISSATSTHTFTLGWAGQLAVSRGGTGAATLTGLVKGNGASAMTAAIAGTDYLGGVGNLTTVGAVPYVSATGTVNQDASAFFWDATNHRLGLGSNAPAYSLDVANGQARFMTAVGFSGGKGGILTTANNSRGGLQFLNASATPVAEFVEDPAYGWRLNTAENVALSFGVNSTTVGEFAGSTGNLLIGGTTDGNFKLDVQKSGSTGTVRFWDQTAVTGFTTVALAAGAGQGINNLLLFQDASLNTMGGIGAAGDIFTVLSSKRKLTQYQASFLMASDASMGWKSVDDLDGGGSFDTCLTRYSANVARVSDCSGTSSFIRARGGITEATTTYDTSLSNSTCALPILTSDTNLQLRCKGSDGTVRHFDITLAP